MEMITLYNIIPKGDGYHELCRNRETGELEQWHRGFKRPLHLVELLFESEEEAQVWLSENGLSEQYVPQIMWMNKEYYTPTTNF
jgi:hypothetical protein